LFPNKTSNDIQSRRTGALVDHVTFKRMSPNETTIALGNGGRNESAKIEPPSYITPPPPFESETTLQLNGTYYIGVFGYSYSTFSLLVTVHRANEEPSLKKVSVQLYEGFPLHKRLHNELDMFFGRFTVENTDDEDSLNSTV
jgi:hypothetical protein